MCQASNSTIPRNFILRLLYYIHSQLCWAHFFGHSNCYIYFFLSRSPIRLFVHSTHGRWSVDWEIISTSKCLKSDSSTMLCWAQHSFIFNVCVVFTISKCSTLWFVIFLSIRCQSISSWFSFKNYGVMNLPSHAIWSHQNDNVMHD